MNTNHNMEDRDDVLIAFDSECQCPTAEQIIEWTQRYPQFAEDIRDHASVSRDIAARVDHSVEEPDENMLARGFSRVLNLLFDAKIAATPNESSATVPTSVPVQSFQQLMSARAKNVPILARELDIERGVLADLMSGRMLAPLGERLISALMSALAIKKVEFDRAFEGAQRAPSFGHAKADKTPVVVARSYEEIIRGSTMTQERKNYWLGQE